MLELSAQKSGWLEVLAALGDLVNVRLVGGHSRCAGRVEILKRGQWGTVCGYGWDLVDAAVVCRELNCGEPVDALTDVEVGPGSGPIWMSGAMCTGSESTMKKCGSTTCDFNGVCHGKSAGVICSDVRLVGGSRCSGSTHPSTHPQTFVFDAGPIKVYRGSSPFQRASFSNVPVGFPGPISSAGFSQSTVFIAPSGVFQLLGSVSAASSVWLVGLASGFPPPAPYCVESPAALRPSRPMSPPWPVNPLTPLRVCIPSSPPRPVFPRTPLGSLVHPDKTQSVIAQVPPWTSRFPAVPRPSTSSVSPGSSLPLVSLSSSLAPSSSQSAKVPALPGNANQLLHLGLPGLVHQPLCSAGSSTYPGFTSVDQLPGVAQSFNPGSYPHRLHHGVGLL
ncbi:hypothetical protein cypCar_00044599 [Cyprinus carpio]|nr:hypothetical protein cypCar_00044599 [Cyprinus carpio]